MVNICIYSVIMLCFLASCIYGISLRKQPHVLPQQMNRSTTDALRGISIMSITLHHMSQGMSSASILTPFRLAGYLGVSIFFFLSGYGLYQSANKKSTYAKGFMIKRITSVYIPAVLAQLLFMLAMSIGGFQHYSLKSWLTGLFILYPIDSSQWYILAALYHYFAFWLAIKFLKTWKHRIVLLVCTAAAYLTFCILTGLSKHWFDTVFCFSFGVAFAAYGKAIISWSKNVRLVLPALVVIFGACVWFSYGKESAPALALRCISSIVFVMLILTLLSIVNLENCKCAAFIGTISLECYLMHGKALRLIEAIVQDIKGIDTVVFLLLTAVLVFGFCILMKYYRSFMNHFVYDRFIH